MQAATKHNVGLGFQATSLTTPATVTVFIHLPVAISQNFRVLSSEPTGLLFKLDKQLNKTKCKFKTHTRLTISYD